MRSNSAALRDVAGLDRLALPLEVRRGRAVRSWAATWPRLAAVLIAVAAWQVLVWVAWRPEFVLPAPATVLSRLIAEVTGGDMLTAIAITMRRAVVGFTIAAAVGVAIGLAVARWHRLRLAVGSLISGLQTMPSIAWFPFAILLFGLSETAILFVVVLGAAPAIANGLLSGIDHIPPLLLRAGRVLGARGIAKYRHVVAPAALPSVISGSRQGWAFAWRSLMAGELLVIIAAEKSIGVKLQFARETSNAPSLLATMIVILIIGIVIDALVFSAADRAIRRRRGLLEPGT